MSTVKQLYPATDTQAITISLASLASDSNLLAGRESTAIDNTSNLDLDAFVSGSIRVGTVPTSGKNIYIYAYGVRKVSSGAPTYPDTITGSDSNRSLTSANTQLTAVKLIATLTVDATTGRDFDFSGLSIAQAFGGDLPLRWGLWVVHNTGVALDSTSGNFTMQYTRSQKTVA